MLKKISRRLIWEDRLLRKAKAKFTTPLILQSKLLCISLLYLVTALAFAAIFTFSEQKCIFRSSPFDPIQSTLFSYNYSYKPENYALPTFRKSCKSPVFFSDYWRVLKEIQDLLGNSSALGSQSLKYMQGMANSFGGNFSFEKRISYYDHQQSNTQIPCGFFKQFPISNEDQIAMERCNGGVVASAIFNDHDKVRQPKGLGTKTLDHVCFFMFVDDVTLRSLDYHNLISRKTKEYNMGAWRIVKVSTENLYENAAMNGVIPKYLVHRLFPNARYSIWIDAKLQLVVDPLLLIHSFIIKEDVDMAISRHPLFVHTIEEAMATARWKKWWDIDGLKTQMETYCDTGLQPWSPEKPYPSDVPDSAMIIRKHSAASNLFSCLIFNELEGFNPRDQLPFAYVRDKMSPKLKIKMLDVEVFEQVVAEYRHNLKKGGGAQAAAAATKGASKTKRAATDLFVNGSFSKCDAYLLKMWGEQTD